MHTRDARLHNVRGAASYLLSERCYDLGGGGSGDRVTDRNSFAIPNGSPRDMGNDGASSQLASLKAFGVHHAIRLHAPGAHRNEQSPEERSLLPSSPGVRCSGMPCISDMSEGPAADAPHSVAPQA